MGTWDTGPFDNDTAADFANVLDDAEPEVRAALIRGVLIRTIDATGYLTEAEEAVALDVERDDGLVDDPDHDPPPPPEQQEAPGRQGSRREARCVDGRAE
ncbi:DUF4259 domain-containing protein [Streptomyces longwoodensis]|uniref:DUF4259 domain-containing protein n=1 Tax=Streptomyces longwoodensis TaxID=68231 RepID=UPI0036F4CCA0